MRSHLLSSSISFIVIVATTFLFKVGFAQADCEQTSHTLLSEYDGQPFEVSMLVFTPRADGANPGSRSLIIFPPTGGTNYIDRSYARQFCRRGYFVTILEGWTGNTGTRIDLDIHQGFYNRMLKAVDVSLGVIKSQYVGVLGTSLGGLYASVAASKIERIDAVFTIVAGTPITEIIVSSDHKDMKRLAKARKQKLGLDTREKYITALRAAFHLEPTLQPPLEKQMSFGAIISSKDTVVPAENQKQLVEFWNTTKVRSLDYDHFWTIVSSWFFYCDEIVDFFDSSFSK